MASPLDILGGIGTVGGDASQGFFGGAIEGDRYATSRDYTRAQTDAIRLNNQLRQLQIMQEQAYQKALPSLPAILADVNRPQITGLQAFPAPMQRPVQPGTGAFGPGVAEPTFAPPSHFQAQPSPPTYGEMIDRLKGADPAAVQTLLPELLRERLQMTKPPKPLAPWELQKHQAEIQAIDALTGLRKRRAEAAGTTGTTRGAMPADLAEGWRAFQAKPENADKDYNDFRREWTGITHPAPKAGTTAGTKPMRVRPGDVVWDPATQKPVYTAPGAPGGGPRRRVEESTGPYRPGKEVKKGDIDGQFELIEATLPQAIDELQGMLLKQKPPVNFNVPGAYVQTPDGPVRKEDMIRAFMKRRYGYEVWTKWEPEQDWRGRPTGKGKFGIVRAMTVGQREPTKKTVTTGLPPQSTEAEGDDTEDAED